MAISFAQSHPELRGLLERVGVPAVDILTNETAEDIADGVLSLLPCAEPPRTMAA